MINHGTSLEADWRKLARMLIWGACALLSISGCGPGAQIRRLEDPNREGLWTEDVKALERFVGDERAADALIKALHHQDPAVRYFAAEVISKHLPRMKEEKEKLALLALVDLLDQNYGGAFTAWDEVPFLPVLDIPLIPVGASAYTRSIGFRALLTLMEATGADYGFDADQWREMITRKRGLALTLPPASIRPQTTPAATGDEHPQIKAECGTATAVPRATAERPPLDADGTTDTQPGDWPDEKRSTAKMYVTSSSEKGWFSAADLEWRAKRYAKRKNIAFDFSSASCMVWVRTDGADTLARVDFSSGIGKPFLEIKFDHNGLPTDHRTGFTVCGTTLHVQP